MHAGSVARVDRDARPTGFRRYCRLRLALLLPVLALLAACAAQRIAVQPRDLQALGSLPAVYRFERAALGSERGVGAARVAQDAAVRAALSDGFAARGYLPGSTERPAMVLLDFTVLDRLAANEKRLDSPSDYQRSWRDPGISQDGSGAMDHTVADAAFGRELSLTVLLRAADTRALLWEGTVTRVIAADAELSGALAPALDNMAAKLLAELPRR